MRGRANLRGLPIEDWSPEIPRGRGWAATVRALAARAERNGPILAAAGFRLSVARGRPLARTGAWVRSRMVYFRIGGRIAAWNPSEGSSAHCRSSRLSVALGCRSASTVPSPGQSAQLFEATVARKVSYRYLLYVPKAYAGDPARRWPLLLFLHGSGERGDDLAKVKVHGPPKQLDGRDDFPFVVVSPQCPEDQRWQADALAALLDDVTKPPPDRPRPRLRDGPLDGRARNVGPRDVVPGALRRHRSRLRGRPAGPGLPAEGRARSKAFHGAKDTVVPLAESETVVDAVKKCGGTAELVVYPEAGHDSWTVTYADPSLWEWLLARRRNPRAH